MLWLWQVVDVAEYIMDYDGWAEGVPVGEYLNVRDTMHERKRERIVRCRDCEHMHRVRDWLGMDVDECWLHASRETGALGKERTEPDGFCAWGVRREDA